jgi:hypothetical protein
VAYYRCRFPQEYALANRVAHPSNVYLREDVLVEPLDGWLLGALAPHRVEEAVQAMQASQDDDVSEVRMVAARAAIRECEAKLARYRAALDSGADPGVVSGWIAQTQAQRALAESELRQATKRTRMTRDEIRDLVTALGDLQEVLRAAAPADKAQIYQHLGLKLTYHPETQTVRAEANLDPHRGVDRVRGPTPHVTPR